jgi:aspartate racemase
MGSVAAAYFFKRLVELTPAKIDQDYIETFVHNNTAIPDRTAGILDGRPSPLPEIERSVALLNNLEVDYIIIACMTSYYFYDKLQQKSSAQIINALTETACHAKNQLPGINRVGIIASTGAITLNLFQSKFNSLKIETTVLNEANQKYYFTEPIYEPWGIKAGFVTGQPKDRFLKAVDILIQQGAEAIIAGCSELPLVLKQNEIPVPLLDSIDVLIKTAVNKCLEKSIYAL